MSLTTVDIWGAFRDKLRHFVVNRVADPDDAEDILQEVFVKIHNNIDRLDKKSALPAWLYRIARNTVIDYYRARSEEAKLNDDIALEPVCNEVDAETELAASLRFLMNGLPQKYRQALIMSELEGMKQTELAEHLGISVSGAKSRIQRARQMLREELLACCHFEFDRRGTIINYIPRPDCCQNCQC